jgi:hypothetical protein
MPTLCFKSPKALVVHLRQTHTLLPYLSLLNPDEPPPEGKPNTNLVQIQFAKHMKLKKKEDQSVDTSFLLRTKHPWKELQRRSSEQSLKERKSRDCLTWGSSP